MEFGAIWSGIIIEIVAGVIGVRVDSSLVDAVGYAGATLTLWLTGFLAEHLGWDGAFLALALLAAATAGAALVFYRTQERPPTRELVTGERIRCLPI